MKNQAFTLIELLVVVLIIGILAAIAIPQYQKAVSKSHATEAILNLKTLKKAQDAYYLANGKYANDLTKLDLDFTPGFYFYFCREEVFDCYANRLDGKTPFFEYADFGTPALYCRGNQKDCEPFSTNNTSGNYWQIE